MRLRHLRLSYDYTQKDLANMLNCGQNTYSQYETTNRTIPIDSLKILANIYKTSIDFLVDFTDVEKPYPRKKL